VLCLENFSGGSTQKFFADGVTELFITDLAQLGALGRPGASELTPLVAEG